MMREEEKSELKMVLQGAWVKGFRWFALGTDASALDGPGGCTHVGSISSAFWPFENVTEIGVTPELWTALDPAPKRFKTFAVDSVIVVWVGNDGMDGSTVWHGTIYPRR